MPQADENPADVNPLDALEAVEEEEHSERDVGSEDEDGEDLLENQER